MLSSIKKTKYILIHMPREKIEVRILQAISRHGLPLGIALWFFLVHQPKHDKMVEDRIEEITDVHTRYRDDQSKLIATLSTDFKVSLKETMSIVRQLEQSIKEMSAELGRLKASAAMCGIRKSTQPNP